MVNNIEKFRVLLTASSLSPVGLNTAISLGGRVQKLVGVDVNTAESYAKKFCEAYYQVPLASDSKYIEKILDICTKEKITTILPLTIEETIVLKENQDKLENLDVRIANSNTLENILICNDKFLTYQFLKNAGVCVPAAFAVSNSSNLSDAAVKLGYPDKEIVFKPRAAHGSRGFRIITERYDKFNLLLNSKPTENIFLSLKELKDIIGQNDIRCVVMEKLDGDDYSVYSFSLNGEALVIVPMKRLGLVPGMSTGGEIVNNKKIIEYVTKIISAFKFNGSINIQLKLTKDGPMLYEINSRISATTVIVRAAGLNFPLYEVLLAHGLFDDIKNRVSNSEVKWGLKMNRIHQEIYNDNGNYFFI